MMKKTTQTLLLVLSSLLLLVSVTVSAQGQPAQDRRRGNAVSFAGVWNAVTGKGKKIVMTLRIERADPSVVTGNYSPIDAMSASYKPADSSFSGFVKVSAFMAGPAPQNLAQINGKVTDNVLRFTWIEDGGHGAGRFTLSSDGESFEGTFSATSNPDDTTGGTLNGTRAHSFAGAWYGKLGEGTLQLILQQTGSRVTGQVNVNSANMGRIVEGIIVDNTLRFTIVRVLISPNGRPLPDQYAGTGELVMDKGGKSFKGTMLGVATNGTLVGR